MIETAVCNSAKLEFLLGIHLNTDRYKIALYTEEATLNAETTVYSTENEVGDQGYTAGGKRLSPAAFVLKNGEARILFSSEPITWENASIRARGAMIYNASRLNKALAVFGFMDDKGKPQIFISTNGPFEVKIPDSGAIILS